MLQNDFTNHELQQHFGVVAHKRYVCMTGRSNNSYEPVFNSLSTWWCSSELAPQYGPAIFHTEKIAEFGTNPS